MNRKLLLWYQNNIFPVLMKKSLGSDEIKKERKHILSFAKGEILEIGIGTGSNLPFYPERVTKISAIDYYTRDLNSERIEVELKPYSCEHMLFENNSFDTVISTFCLCSINNPDQALQEIRRVLKPGGKLLFLEHGKAKTKFIQKMQNVVNPLYNILACGCNVNRNHYGFERTKTLGDGDECCNCRYYIKGDCDWSPEKGFNDRK